MTQSSRLHAAIIMDGNGRWAEQRGWDRRRGHPAGGAAAERIIEAAPALGIGVLTLFAFSSDNWNRPMPEVTALWRLFRARLRTESARAAASGVAIEVIGRRDRLPAALVREIERAEAATRGGANLRLRLAVDYSSREAILAAAIRLAGSPGPRDRAGLTRLLESPAHQPVPPVDLLIRTGGEQRLSDFLLWESAYAELFFTPTLWPDFTAAELRQIVTRFHQRERRFGGLVSRPSASASRVG